MSDVERPGWRKPYVGCVNWGGGGYGYGYPRAVVIFRGHDSYFDTWAEAIEYATAFGRRVIELERTNRARAAAL